MGPAAATALPSDDMAGDSMRSLLFETIRCVQLQLRTLRLWERACVKAGDERMKNERLCVSLSTLACGAPVTVRGISSLTIETLPY